MNEQNNSGLNISNSGLNNTQPVVNNNPINNGQATAINPTMVNSQAVSQHGVQSQPVINQPVNNGVYQTQPTVNPGYGSQQPNIVNNQYTQSQPVNNGVNSNYYGQPMPSNNIPGGKKTMDTKTLVLIVGVIALVTICAVLAILLLTNDDDNKESENKNVNEYEETTTDRDDDIIDNESDDQDVSSNTIQYTVFEFTKVDGYTYSSDTGGLTVENNYYKNILEVVTSDYEDVNDEIVLEKLRTSYENQGIVVQNTVFENYGGQEFIIMDLSYDDQNAIYFITKASNGYVFEGVIANYLNTFDHDSNLGQVLPIIQNARYVGGTFNAKTEFNANIKLPELD